MRSEGQRRKTLFQSAVSRLERSSAVGRGARGPRTQSSTSMVSGLLLAIVLAPSSDSLDVTQSGSRSLSSGSDSDGGGRRDDTKMRTTTRISTTYAHGLAWGQTHNCNAGEIKWKSNAKRGVKALEEELS